MLLCDIASLIRLSITLVNNGLLLPIKTGKLLSLSKAGLYHSENSRSRSEQIKAVLSAQPPERSPVAI
jgi:hypothetical protein